MGKSRRRSRSRRQRVYFGGHIPGNTRYYNPRNPISPIPPIDWDNYIPVEDMTLENSGEVLYRNVVYFILEETRLSIQHADMFINQTDNSLPNLKFGRLFCKSFDIIEKCHRLLNPDDDYGPIELYHDLRKYTGRPTHLNDVLRVLEKYNELNYPFNGY